MFMLLQTPIDQAGKVIDKAQEVAANPNLDKVLSYLDKMGEKLGAAGKYLFAAYAHINQQSSFFTFDNIAIATAAACNRTKTKTHILLQKRMYTLYTKPLVCQNVSACHNTLYIA